MIRLHSNGYQDRSRTAQRTGRPQDCPEANRRDQRNEIKFQIACDSDPEFITKTMQEVVEDELGEQRLDLVQVYCELLQQTPIGELEIQERPVVHLRASENTWLGAIPCQC